MNIYNYEDGKLQVKTVVTKSLEDVQQCIANNRPQKGVDTNIAAYIPTLDPAQIQADEWYEYLLILEAPFEAGKEEPVLNEDGEYTYDDDGQLITSIGLNSHEKALNKRKELESTNPWLKGLRGVKSAPKRPEFTLTVEQWKENNKILLEKYNKAKGTLIKGYTISLNKDNSDGLVSIQSAYGLVGDAIFPTNFKADTLTGTVMIPLENYTEFMDVALPFLAARGQLFK